jgi:tRNA modification GTPase
MLQLAVCHMSCETDHGVDVFLELLRSKVASLCGDPSGDPSSPPSLTQARHRHHLTQALHALEAYTATMGAGGAAGDMVLAAQELRIALRQIGKLTGNITSEEILDVIFKDFCIGK